MLKSLAADSQFRHRIWSVYALLAVMNVAAWLWAVTAFAGQPVRLGIAVVVYGLGLRHAVDADHIAAIDNVTRKFLQDGRRSASIGFWFALGHSAVIFLATAALVAAAGRLNHFMAFREIGGDVSASVSGVFLILVAAMNFCIFLTIVRTIRRARAGNAVEPAELDILFTGNGLFARIFRPLFGLISQPWHMGLLGLVFGLSFDTASEVALFGVSATQTSHGVAFGEALVYPTLFAAGMSLLDTTDGVMMVGAYDWAVADPLRKLYYNMAITLASIFVALFVGGVQLGALIVRWFGFGGVFARAAVELTADLNHLGIAIIAVFAIAWAASGLIWRFVGTDSLHSVSGTPS